MPHIVTFLSPLLIGHSIERYGLPLGDSLCTIYAQAVDAGLAGLARTVSCRVRETDRRSASWRSWINTTNF